MKEAVPSKLIALLVLGLVALSGARAAEAKEPPILALDTGGHMALIRSVLFTPDGKQLLSAGDDKVIRVWDVDSGKTVRTLRGQIGDGGRGKIYALALSPDASLLAAGGRIREEGEGSHPIRLYDFKTGEIVGLLDGHTNAVMSVAFSPDGRFLVSGSVDDTAIIWDVAERRALHRLAVHSADINRVAFTRDGARVVTASDDKTLALWDVKSGTLLSRSVPHAGNVFGLAISPATGEIASSSQGGEVRLSNDKTLAVIRRFRRQAGDILDLSFSPDGKKLLSGTGTAPYRCLVWDVARGDAILTYGGHDLVVVATAISPQGQLNVTAGGSNNEIHLWDPQTGRLAKKLSGVGQSVWAVGLSNDGTLLGWGHTRREQSINQRGPLQYELRFPTKDRPIGEPRQLRANPATMRRAVTASGQSALRHRAGGNYGYDANLDILASGRVVATIGRDEKSGFAHNAYTLTPKGDGIVTGSGNGWLTAFNARGAKLGDFIGHTSDVWTVAVSADGRLLASGSDDQTVRLWNVATQENIVSLFYGQDGEWIIWTPQGFFTASPNGDSYVGWHVNEGEGKAARYVTAAQLKRHFYRPDIVKRALELASAKAAIAEALDTDFSLNELLVRRPPEFAVVTPENGSKVTGSPLRFKLSVNTNTDPVEGFDVTVNNRRVFALSQGDAPGKIVDEHDVTFDVPLSSGRNEVEFVAYNAVGKTEHTVYLDNSGKPDIDERGNLYVVSIGINKYPNFSGQDLDFAESDAVAVRDILVKRAGPLHASTEERLYATEGGLAPTSSNIRSAMKELSKATPRDTIIIFLAGHGINDGPDYFFLPTDAAAKGGKLEPSTAISWRDLNEIMQTTRGQRILLVDTCHAGNAYNARLIKDAADEKIAVLAATDAETLAKEEPDLKHGVFTYSVLEGLGGKADSNKDGQVEVGELSNFAVERVVKMTGGTQTPRFFIASSRHVVLSR